MVWRCALPVVRRACERAWAPFLTAFCTSFFRELVPFLPGFDLADVVLAVQVEMVYRLWMLIQKLVRLADGRLALEEFPRLFLPFIVLVFSWF